jgi:hypothetical protein
MNRKYFLKVQRINSPLIDKTGNTFTVVIFLLIIIFSIIIFLIVYHVLKRKDRFCVSLFSSKNINLITLENNSELELNNVIE